MKKRFFLSPLRLIDWIDNHESETTRRVFQGLIILGIGSSVTIIYQQRESLVTWFTSNSKSIWTLLDLPIQLKVWFVVLLFLSAFSLTWVIHWFREKDKKVSKSDNDIALKTSARFCTVTDMDNNSRPAIEVEAVNPKPRPIILKTFTAIFANKNEVGSGLGNGSSGFKLDDQRNYVAPLPF